MPYKQLASDRLNLTSIDLKSIEELRNARAIVEPAIDEMLNKLYVRVLDNVSTNSIAATVPQIDQLRRDLKSHWKDALFGGNFDENYRKSTFKLARAHAAVGLTSEWYIESYNQILCQLMELIFRHFAERNEPAVSIIQTISKIFFLDMDLVLASYLDAKDELMRNMLLRSTELREDMWRFSDELNFTAGKLESTARELSQDTHEFQGSENENVAGSITKMLGNADAVLDQAKHLRSQTIRLDEHLKQLPFNEKLYLREGGLFRRLKEFIFEKQYQGNKSGLSP